MQDKKNSLGGKNLGGILLEMPFFFNCLFIPQISSCSNGKRLFLYYFML